jgi:anaerobic magnesium-protoporphyrin IX monomethyl ester cyclase
MFQFEIGVQSCSPETLKAVHRHVSLDKSFENIARLRADTAISLHLDLVAGLPYENYPDFLASIDRTAALKPHHLQIELVKLLPGSILRKEAHQEGIEYDPHPPYTVLRTRELNFGDLTRLRGIGRVVDMTFNSGRFKGFLDGLAMALGSLSCAFEKIEEFWTERDLFRYPLQRSDLFENLWLFIQSNFSGENTAVLTELLARDCARSERVVPGKVPAFFNTDLSLSETEAVGELVCGETRKVKGKGVKVQYFVASFSSLPELDGPTILVFLYLTGSGRKMEVKEIVLPTEKSAT